MMLKISDLVVNYGSINAVKGISLEIAECEIVCLIGANGAGKSTILRSIMGLKKIQSGEIAFNNQTITNWDTSKIVSLGVTLSPEGRQIFPDLSTYDNLMLGGYLRSDEENDEELEKVFVLFPQLKDRIRQTAGTLSGGEQQMLAVARALMSKPKLLLMDEPSLGLAPMLVKELFALIGRCRLDLNTTILLVEQNANMALQLSDRAYVLETGKIVLAGQANELLGSEFVRKAYLGGI